MNPVAGCVTLRTAVDHLLPRSIASGIRFAIEEVEVLLPHKEWRAINRIRAVADLVILNRELRRPSRAQRAPGDVAQYNQEGLCGLGIAVVNDRNRNVL